LDEVAPAFRIPRGRVKRAAPARIRRDAGLAQRLQIARLAPRCQRRSLRASPEIVEVREPDAAVAEIEQMLRRRPNALGVLVWKVPAAKRALPRPHSIRRVMEPPSRSTRVNAGRKLRPPGVRPPSRRGLPPSISHTNEEVGFFIAMSF
jgi:hypothetical protein